MNNKLLLAVLFGMPLTTVAQNDLIILRNGSEIPAKIVLVDGKQITYKEKSNANSKELSQELKDVYMIRYEKRGNIYITEDGKRKTGENDKWKKQWHRIYLVRGEEIQVTNLRINENNISFTPAIDYPQSKVGTGYNIPLDKVFMVKYSDGTKDIITDITSKPKVEQVTEVVEDTVSAIKENELKVVFHNVKRNQTMAMIAKQYKVNVNDIIKWNDLPKATRKTTRLRVGTQLMIYVKPQ